MYVEFLLLFQTRKKIYIFDMVKLENYFENLHDLIIQFDNHTKILKSREGRKKSYLVYVFKSFQGKCFKFIYCI